MSKNRVRHTATLLMVAILVLSPMTLAVGAVTTTTQAENTYQVTDNVQIWERSPLSFTLDSTDAAKTIQTGSNVINLKAEGTGEVTLRDEVSVYPSGKEVTANLDNPPGVPTSQFNGNDTQVVIAQLNSNAPDEASMEMLPSSLAEAKELFTTENANQNATFWVKNNTEEISNGDLESEITFHESGTYAVFLATGSAFDAPPEGGDISISGETTIVGMTGAVVEDQRADVTVENQQVNPGTNASFTVDTGTTSANVSVLLYNSSTVEDSRTEFIVEEPISSSLNASDLTIRHSIANVNGVAKFDGEVNILGTTLNDGRISGSTSIAGILERAIDEANARNDEVDRTIEQPTTEVIQDSEQGGPYENTLDASVVAKSNVDGSTTIDVPTFGNWSQGAYSYLVVSTGPTQNDIRTETGELTVTIPDDGGDDGDGSQPTVGGGASPGSTVDARNGRVNVSLTGTTPNQPVRVQVPVDETTLQNNGHALSGMRLNFNKNSSGTINVSTITTPNTPSASPNGDIGHFKINHTVPNDAITNATFEFSVSKQRLQNRSINASDVVLYRYENNNWRALPTRQINETSTAYRYEADSPGLSLYAISTAQQNTDDDDDSGGGGGGGGGGGFIPAPGGSDANISVTSASVTPTDITVGESTTVTATIENHGSAAGEFTADLQIDGSTTDSTTVQLNASEQTTIEFTTSFDEAGEYTVSVSGVDAGTVSVTADTTTQQPTTTQPTTTTPGGNTGGGDGGPSPVLLVGVLIVVAALAAAGYLYQQE